MDRYINFKTECNQTKQKDNNALENRVLDGAYQSNTNVVQKDKEEVKRGKETKRWATPFYSGKMGV